ncbi:hypothetical protein QR680_008197 [Steinernema hermaphroditum]|uniref:Uncharacterized protein n=1 Tax=Steinernema hermaphroditum TaxID=289476 RepID=A0AA39M6M2_9BILA|nr:hypothetical protein QR680_008197 [Steinernema hermaphroditum]
MGARRRRGDRFEKAEWGETRKQKVHLNGGDDSLRAGQEDLWMAGSAEDRCGISTDRRLARPSRHAVAVTNFVGPVPTLTTYSGGLTRYHGPKMKLASLWLKDSGTFTTNATAVDLEKTGAVSIAYVQHVPENSRKSIQIVARPHDQPEVTTRRMTCNTKT